MHHPRLSLLDLKLVLEPLRTTMKIPLKVAKLRLVSLLLLLPTLMLLRRRPIVSSPIVLSTRLIITQYFKRMNDSVKGFGSLFRRHILVFVGVRVQGLSSVGLLDLFGCCFSTHSQDLVQIFFCRIHKHHDQRHNTPTHEEKPAHGPVILSPLGSRMHHCS